MVLEMMVTFALGYIIAMNVHNKYIRNKMYNQIKIMFMIGYEWADKQFKKHNL